MRVLGTAGHVDHGKSKLIERLTGIHPDRLQEEQEREMTIDLGFAWMKLPGGEEVGIIDVPGHRDFIENMLAGIGGIDAALFVVAADEGVMPQTREHLAILDLLEVQECIVALTKIDLIEDREWLRMVREDVWGLTEGTRFEGAEIIEVSAVSGEGIDDLIEAIEKKLSASNPRWDIGRPRLPIDRAFTMAGFGTVVTGTLIDGKLEVGNEIVVLPVGLKGRIRGLQTHRSKVGKAVPGSRVAANLTGVDVNEVARGDVVCFKGDFENSKLLDAKLRVLEDAPSPLKHNQQVKVFIGAAQRMARVRLLGMDQLAQGKNGWIQLVLDEDVIAARGDRFILRRPSPGATIGGGRIADAHPVKRYRRMDPGLIDRLEGLMSGRPAEVLLQTLQLHSPMSIKEVINRAEMDTVQAERGLEELITKGNILALESGEIDANAETAIIDRGTWKAWLDRVYTELDSFHKLYPLRIGMPREELKSRMRAETKAFNLMLEHAIEERDVLAEGYRVLHPTHKPKLSENQAARWKELKDRFESSRYSPPSVKECIEAIGDEMMNFLFNQGELIKVSEDVVFEVETYKQMVEIIREKLNAQLEITVAEVRDIFRTSRKYALALMEHLDGEGVTVREGDARRLA